MKNVFSKLALVAVLGLVGIQNAMAGAVVVAANSPAAEMDAEAVRRVFLGRETQLSGTAVTVIYQSGGATRDQFDQGVLQKAGAELTTYWSRLIFTGRAQAPTEVADDAAVKARVTSTPGAIGYVSDAAVDSSVKVLFRF